MDGKKSVADTLTDRLDNLEDRIGGEVRHPNDINYKATIMACIEALDEYVLICLSRTKMRLRSTLIWKAESLLLRPCLHTP